MASLGIHIRVNPALARRVYGVSIADASDSPLKNALPSTPTWDGDQNPEVRRRLEVLLYGDTDLLDACTTTRAGTKAS